MQSTFFIGKDGCMDKFFSLFNLKICFFFYLSLSLPLLMTLYIVPRNVKEYFNEPTNGNDNLILFPETNSSDPKFRWCSNESLSSSIDLDCEKLFIGDQKALQNASNWTSPCTFSDAEAMKITSNCTSFKTDYPFWNEFYQSPNDGDEYSLAFVLIGAKNAEQIIRLLQSVYHPKNIYCITYDNKTSHEFKQTFHNLDQCYDNIVMPETFVDIYWAGYSILQTAMFCLETLNKQKVNWKYVQILSWNDFPLRTNHEFIQIMKIFNGSQDSLLKLIVPEHTRKYYYVANTNNWMKIYRDPAKMSETKSVPPGNLIEFKGSLATTMSREFVEFLFMNPVAKKFYHWMKDSYCAEEVYWSTLIHNLHINPPGGFPGACHASYEADKTTMSYMSRFQVWHDDNKCQGKIVMFSCVYGVRDLFILISRPEFMAHKLYLDFEPAAYYCLSQLHFNRTFFPHLYPPFNETFYRNLAAVRYRRMEDKEKFTC